MKTDNEQAVKVLEHAIKHYAEEDTTHIPLGILNDILDLITSTDKTELPFEKHHKRCGSIVSTENVSGGYTYVCPQCDEDLFTFEVE